MTIKELYEWAVERGVENYNIEIQYRDGGGYYYGTDTLHQAYIEIVSERSEVIL